MLEHLTPAQIRSALKDRDSLVQLLESSLGYRTNLVSYEATDLGVAPYLAKRVNSWWLLSHYTGNLPFQIHLVQLGELPAFNLCRDIVDSFRRHRPGYFLFTFTQDYCYVLFITVELSLERRPYTWLRLPKPYYRFLLANRTHPSPGVLEALTRLRVEPSESDPARIHKKVLEALRFSEHPSELPKWFWSAWYYRLGYSQDAYDRLKDSGKI